MLEKLGNCHSAFNLRSPALADKNDIGDANRDRHLKYIPSLRLPEFSLLRAADYLEAWISDVLPEKPLLDVSALHD